MRTADQASLLTPAGATSSGRSEDAAQDRVRSRLLSLLLRHKRVSSNHNVLVTSVGDGEGARLFLNAGATVYGVDGRASALKAADAAFPRRFKALRRHDLNRPIANLGFKWGQFDVIVADLDLDTVREPVRLLRSFRYLLDPLGKLAFTVSAPSSGSARGEVAMPQAIRDMLAKARLRELAMEQFTTNEGGVERMHYAFVAAPRGMSVGASDDEFGGLRVSSWNRGAAVMTAAHGGAVRTAGARLKALARKLQRGKITMNERVAAIALAESLGADITPFQLKRPILITGCSRSGTFYTSLVLAELGCDVPGEGDGKHGSTSWLMNGDSFGAPFGPRPPEGQSFQGERYTDHGECFNFQRLGGKLFKFEKTFHQVRNPIKTIASQFTEQDIVWRFVERFIPEVSDAALQQRFGDAHSPKAELYKRAKFWVEWNRRAEAKSEFTFRVEDIETVLPKLIEAMGVGRYDLEAIRHIPTNTNTREKKADVAFSDIVAADPDLAREVRELAHKYGYSDDELGVSPGDVGIRAA
jgi:SAM-dependent methyltransferase